MARRPVSRRRAQLSWAFYDWANSAFATTVMAGFFPVFFKSYWASGMTATESTVRLGTANAVASLLVVLLAPLLGVIADRSGRKKALLLMLALLGVLMSGGLFLVAEGYWLVAVGLYVLGVIGFAGGNVTYDAMLLEVAERSEFERLSALGFALGYLGGGLLFAVNVLMVLHPEAFGLADKAEAVRVAFLCVAAWWAVFSLPLLLFVHEKPSPQAPTLGAGTRRAWREMVETWRLLRRLPMAFTFLIAYWCYIDGVDTIVRMAVDYGLSLGFAADSLLTALLITQFVGFPAALLFGRIGDRIGAQRAIWLALIVYVIAVFWAWRMAATRQFYGLAVMPSNHMGKERLLAVKDRALSRGIPLIIDEADEIERWVDEDSAEVQVERQRLQEEFWPGPLTLIVAANAAARDFFDKGVFACQQTPFPEFMMIPGWDCDYHCMDLVILENLIEIRRYLSIRIQSFHLSQTLGIQIADGFNHRFFE